MVKRILKKSLKVLGYILLIPIVYILISLLLTAIPVNTDETSEPSVATVYLNTNGVHLDVILPIESVEKELLYGLVFEPSERFLSFGWGDEDFYINTPEWSDLTLSTALNAAFLNCPTLVHITRYRAKRSDWIPVQVNLQQLTALNKYLLESFQPDELGEKQLLAGKGYTSRDNFYRARGNYSCFKTCNSWVNTAFKESGLKAALWTPFDFGLMNKYR